MPLTLHPLTQLASEGEISKGLSCGVVEGYVVGGGNGFDYRYETGVIRSQQQFARAVDKTARV